MNHRIYKKCILTHQDSEVLEDFDRETYPSVKLSGKYIYSPCYGIVVQVCKYNRDNLYSVVIQYNEIIFIRFTDLHSVFVKSGQRVVLDTIVGLCNNWFNFELIVPQIETIPPPAFRVVISKDVSLYKADPRVILDGRIMFELPSES